MRVSEVAMPDVRDNESSVRGGPWVPAMVSFDVEWRTPLARATLRNEDEAWGGEYAETESRIAWSARQEGFAYQSDPLSTATSVWGMVGRQRSGVYFRQLGLPRTGAPASPAGAPPAGVRLGAAGVALAMAGLASRWHLARPEPLGGASAAAQGTFLDAGNDHASPGPGPDADETGSEEGRPCPTST